MRCTMPMSASVGTTRKTMARAASITRPVSGGSRRRMSVPHNIREEEPAGHCEDHVEGGEHAEPAARPGEPADDNRAGGLHGADQERHEEWQEQERQHHLARPDARRERPEEGGEGREAHVAEEADEQERRQARDEVEVEEEARERQDDRLHDGQQDDVGGELAGVDRRGVDRRREQARQAVVLALEEEAALDTEEPGQDEGRPQDARGERRRRLGRRVVRDRQDDEEEHAEDEDGGDALARAPLDAEVLGEDGERVAHPQVRSATTARYAATIIAASSARPSCTQAMRPRWRIARRDAIGAARSTSWVARRIEWPAARSSRSCCCSRSTASGSRPLKGSSRRSRSGSWRRTRASARRWPMPRE